MCNALPAELLNVKKIVTHFCWDSFDLNEETPDGHETTHSTHGIAIQEHSGNKEEPTEDCVHLQRSKRRSLQLQKEELAPCIIPKRISVPIF